MFQSLKSSQDFQVIGPKGCILWTTITSLFLLYWEVVLLQKRTIWNILRSHLWCLVRGILAAFSVECPFSVDCSQNQGTILDRKAFLCWVFFLRLCGVLRGKTAPKDEQNRWQLCWRKKILPFSIYLTKTPDSSTIRAFPAVAKAESDFGWKMAVITITPTHRWITFFIPKSINIMK